MKLKVDENIAFAEEAFSQFGDVMLLSGRGNIFIDFKFHLSSNYLILIVNVKIKCL